MAKILLLDDNYGVLNAMARSLGKSHTITTSTQARSSLTRIFEGERFDAVLCDLTMPDMSGIAFYMMLRERCPAQAERIILLSGNLDAPAVQVFLSKIPNFRFAKPWNIAEIKSAIEELVARGEPIEAIQ